MSTLAINTDSETGHMGSADETECDMRCETQYGKKRGRTSSCDTYAAECSDIEDSEPDNRNPSDFSKRQKRLYFNPFICPPKKLDSEFDDYLFLDCADKTIRPLSRKTLQMDLRSFFNLCTAQFGAPREIKSLNFRTSDGTACSAYRDGNDGQWQHLLGFLDVDEHSWIRVSIDDDHDDDFALEIWFQWLDPSKMPEELKRLLTHDETDGENACRALDMGKMLAKVWVFS